MNEKENGKVKLTEKELEELLEETTEEKIKERLTKLFDDFIKS